jgi:sugar lactone lactonase YvrE
VSIEEAEVKRAIASRSQRVILAVDHTKLGSRAQIRGIPLDEVQVASDGAIYISDRYQGGTNATAGGAVYRVDRQTGNRALISNLATGTGENFGSVGESIFGPWGMAIVDWNPATVGDWKER